MGFKKIENTIQDMRIKKKEKIDEKKNWPSQVDACRI